MAKFKEGDKVCIVKKSEGNLTGGGAHVGADYLKPETFTGLTGYITSVGSYGTWSYTLYTEGSDTNTYLGLYNDNEIKLVEEAKPAYKTITPKIGERYRVVKPLKGHYFFGSDGERCVGNIIEYVEGGSFKAVNFIGTNTQSLSPEFGTTEYLELVEEIKPLTINGDYFEGLVNAITPGYHYYISGAPTKPIKQSLITKSMNFIKKLTQSAADKTLEKAGFTNSCGELTSRGNDALTSLVFQEKKDALVKLAEEVIAEETK